jgi:predicted RNA-binding Zn-ribbon protein involved in translation (DUF1610 family)
MDDIDLDGLTEEEIDQFIKLLLKKKELHKKSETKATRTHSIKEGQSSRRQRKNTKRKEAVEPQDLLEQHRESRRKSKKTKGSACKREPIQVNKKRVNLFEKIQLSKGELDILKKDSEIDKKLQKGWGRTPRNREDQRVAVVCRDCGTTDIVNYQTVPQDPSRYRCNDCSQTGSQEE